MRSHSAIPFDFKSDCIFCGVACDVKTDDKHPTRRSKKERDTNTDSRWGKWVEISQRSPIKSLYGQKQVFGAVLV